MIPSEFQMQLFQLNIKVYQSIFTLCCCSHSFCYLQWNEDTQRAVFAGEGELLTSLSMYCSFCCIFFECEHWDICRKPLEWQQLLQCFTKLKMCWSAAKSCVNFNWFLGFEIGKSIKYFMLFFRQKQLKGIYFKPRKERWSIWVAAVIQAQQMGWRIQRRLESVVALTFLNDCNNTLKFQSWFNM